MSLAALILHNNLWSRIRHRKGEGIHSPFAFGIVSEAFAGRNIADGGRELYDALRAKGVSRKYAVRMQNLYTYVGFDKFAADVCEPLSCGQVLYIMTPAVDEQSVRGLLEKIGPCGSAVCLTRSRKNNERYRFCMSVVEGHFGMSMDITGCILLYFRHGLSKQHIKL